MPQGQDKRRAQRKDEEQMTKELALDIVKLLSALDSWCFSSHGRIPEYLSEKLTEVVHQMETIILKDEK